MPLPSTPYSPLMHPSIHPHRSSSSTTHPSIYSFIQLSTYPSAHLATYPLHHSSYCPSSYPSTYPPSHSPTYPPLTHPPFTSLIILPSEISPIPLLFHVHLLPPIHSLACSHIQLVTNSHIHALLHQSVPSTHPVLHQTNSFTK